MQLGHYLGSGFNDNFFCHSVLHSSAGDFQKNNLLFKVKAAMVRCIFTTRVFQKISYSLNLFSAFPARGDEREEDRPLRQGVAESLPAVLQQAEVPQTEGGSFRLGRG